MKSFKQFLSMESTTGGYFSDSDFLELGDNWVTKKIGDATLIFIVRGSIIDLASVRVPTRKRRSGTARVALNALIAEADKRGMTIKLLASPLDKKTNLGKLVSFYQSLGFKVIGRGNLAGHPNMIKTPTTH